MKILKTTSLKSDFKFKRVKRRKKEIEELVHQGLSKSSNSFESKKASNSLVVQMYSQENEVLFI
jgi:hypothetical protein